MYKSAIDSAFLKVDAVYCLYNLQTLPSSVAASKLPPD